MFFFVFFNLLACLSYLHILLWLTREHRLMQSSERWLSFPYCVDLKTCKAGITSPGDGAWAKSCGNSDCFPFSGFTLSTMKTQQYSRLVQLRLIIVTRAAGMTLSTKTDSLHGSNYQSFASSKRVESPLLGIKNLSLYDFSSGFTPEALAPSKLFTSQQDLANVLQVSSYVPPEIGKPIRG